MFIGKDISRKGIDGSYYIFLKCPQCGLVRSVPRIGPGKIARMRCRSCAMKEMTNRAEMKALRSKNAAAQVRKQGGIPNAVHSNVIPAKSGALHHNWRGGISPENYRIRRGGPAMDWRIAVFERDSFTCRLCGERGGRLNAHHVLSFAKHPESRFDMDNWVTLCEPCHRSVHNGTKIWLAGNGC